MPPQATLHAHPEPAAGVDATGATCLLLVALLVVLTARLTHGFEAWTYEDLRRRQAVAGALRAPAMVLRDAQGATVTAFDGGARTQAVVLLNFIYTRCSSVCQAQGSEYFRMQEALRAAGPAPVRLLSVSIDPEHDATAALAGHARLHRASAAWWTVAAPADADAGQAALRRLGVVAVPDGRGGWVHNGSIHLVDAAGRVRRIFDDASWPQALAAAQALAMAEAGEPPP